MEYGQRTWWEMLRDRRAQYMWGPKAPERQGPGSSGAGRGRLLITYGTGTRAQPES